MKLHTTNYKNTFIEVAEDCPINSGEIPPIRGDKKSVANLQFEVLYENPYRYTSDDVLFAVFVIRKEISKIELEEQRQVFFSKGQACFRASPLTKRYAWGIHSDEAGKIAMYSVDSEEYKEKLADNSIKKLKAMRSKRK